MVWSILFAFWLKCLVFQKVWSNQIPKCLAYKNLRGYNHGIGIFCFELDVTYLQCCFLLKRQLNVTMKNFFPKGRAR